MQLTTALAFLSTVLPIGVSAGCFTSGEVWQDGGAARYHIERACKGYDDNAGAFQGYFSLGQAKSACVQHSGTQNFAFFVQNLNMGAGFDLNDDDCVFRLQNEVNGCSRGGPSDIAGWRFR